MVEHVHASGEGRMPLPASKERNSEARHVPPPPEPSDAANDRAWTEEREDQSATKIGSTTDPATPALHRVEFRDCLGASSSLHVNTMLVQTATSYAMSAASLPADYYSNCRMLMIRGALAGGGCLGLTGLLIWIALAGARRMLGWRRLLIAVGGAEALFYGYRLHRYRELNLPPPIHAPSAHDATESFEKLIQVCQHFRGRIDPRMFLSHWFCGADFESIRRGNLLDLLAYTFWYSSRAEVCASGRELLLAAMARRLESEFGLRLPRGRTDGLRCMFHLWEPLRATHRPLTFYLAIEVVALVTKAIFLGMGFKIHKSKGSCKLTYITYGLSPPESEKTTRWFWRRGSQKPVKTEESTASKSSSSPSSTPPPSSSAAASPISRRDEGTVPNTKGLENGIPANSGAGGGRRGSDNEEEEEEATARAHGRQSHEPRSLRSNLSHISWLYGKAVQSATTLYKSLVRRKQEGRFDHRESTHAGVIVGDEATERPPNKKGTEKAAKAAARKALGPEGTNDETNSFRQSDEKGDGSFFASSEREKTAPHPETAPVKKSGFGSGFSKTPVLLLHGVGLGLTPYVNFLRCLAAAGRPIVALEYKHVSLRLSAAREVPSADDVARCAAAILEELGIERSLVLAHSYGTFVASRLSQSRPDKLAGLCLLDPVCLAMYMPHLLAGSLYRPPRLSSPLTLIVDLWFRHVIMRDLHCAATFCRRFYWSEVNLWPQDLPERTLVALGGRDQLIHVEQVLDLAQHLASKVLFHPMHSHGSFLMDPAWQQQIVADVAGMAAAADDAAADTDEVVASGEASSEETVNVANKILTYAEEGETLTAGPTASDVAAVEAAAVSAAISDRVHDRLVQVFPRRRDFRGNGSPGSLGRKFRRRTAAGFCERLVVGDGLKVASSPSTAERSIRRDPYGIGVSSLKMKYNGTDNGSSNGNNNGSRSSMVGQGSSDSSLKFRDPLSSTVLDVLDFTVNSSSSSSGGSSYPALASAGPKSGSDSLLQSLCFVSHLETGVVSNEPAEIFRDGMNPQPQPASAASLSPGANKGSHACSNEHSTGVIPGTSTATATATAASTERTEMLEAEKKTEQSPSSGGGPELGRGARAAPSGFGRTGRSAWERKFQIQMGGISHSNNGRVISNTNDNNSFNNNAGFKPCSPDCAWTRSRSGCTTEASRTTARLLPYCCFCEYGEEVLREYLGGALEGAEYDSFPTGSAASLLASRSPGILWGSGSGLGLAAQIGSSETEWIQGSGASLRSQVMDPEAMISPRDGGVEEGEARKVAEIRGAQLSAADRDSAMNWPNFSAFFGHGSRKQRATADPESEFQTVAKRKKKKKSPKTHGAETAGAAPLPLVTGSEYVYSVSRLDEEFGEYRGGVVYESPRALGLRRRRHDSSGRGEGERRFESTAVLSRRSLGDSEEKENEKGISPPSSSGLRRDSEDKMSGGGGLTGERESSSIAGAGDKTDFPWTFLDSTAGKMWAPGDARDGREPQRAPVNLSGESHGLDLALELEEEERQEAREVEDFGVAKRFTSVVGLSREQQLVMDLMDLRGEGAPQPVEDDTTAAAAGGDPTDTHSC